MAAKERNMPLEPESKTPQPEIASEPTQSDVLGVPADSIPKLVVCFDISTLSHQKLQAIASDLKLPGYSQMTKEQLCEALLAL
jgi:hypothetical protein